MKKIYILLLTIAASTFSFGQVILTDNLNYGDNDLLTNNGWIAHSGAGTQAIDVGASNGLTYAGYSGVTGIMGAIEGNAAKLDNNGEDVSKTFTAVPTGTIYYSFLVNVTNGTAGYFTHLGNSGTTFAARVFVKPSVTAGKINFGISNTGTASFAAIPTDFDLNTTYLIIVKYDVSATGNASIWIKASGVPATEIAAGTPEHTTSASGITGIERVCLRQFSATQGQIIDGIFVAGTWFGATPCSLALGVEASTCDAVTLNIDTYNTSIPFTGGNSGTYNLSTNVGTIGGDNPSTVATGNITITNIPEGSNVTLTVTGTCSFTKNITSPECKPINALPYTEHFDYIVGNSLGAEQMWTNVNSGDNILVVAGNLAYTGVTPSGNSVSFSGAGIDTFSPFTTTTTSTVYSSFLMNVTDLTNVTTDLTETVFASVTDDLKGFKARIMVKRNGTQYQVGCTSVSSLPAAGTVYGPTLYNVGDVVMVIVGYDFTLNELKLWLNPTLASFTAATPATVTETPAVAFANLGGFLLRQDAAATTPTIIIDELRMATTTAQLAVAQNEINGLRMYPNPVVNGNLYITTNTNTSKEVAIFDVLGKQVVKTTITDQAVNVADLNAGVYIVKITEEGKTATRKLIIR